MNRRGSIEIVLLVLLVLLVTSVALFNFIVGSKSIQANIYDARFIEGVYQKQDLAEFYIRQVGEEVIEKNRENGFKENFKVEFSRYDFDQDYLKDLQKIIGEGKFNIVELAPKGVPSVEEDVNTEGKGFLEVVINSWEVEDSFEQIKIKYNPKISLKFDLKD